MKFKHEMYLLGRIYHTGDSVNITKVQYEAIKDWIEHKSLKTYAHVCIHCFNVHGVLSIPYKFVRVLVNTYFNGFYKTVAANESEEGAEDGK